MKVDGASVDGSTDGLPHLRRELRRPHEAAGAPTYRQLRVQASLAGLHLPTSTAQELLTGRRRPRWGTVETFVLATVEHANSRRPPIQLPPRMDDVGSWRRLYERADGRQNPALPRRFQRPARPLPGSCVEPSVVALPFVLAIDAAHHGLRDVAQARAHLPDRAACANRAVHRSGLYAERERILVLGDSTVVTAGERLFLRLIAIRDAVRDGAGLASADYHLVYHPYAEALWEFRMAVRAAHGQPPLSPGDVERTNWRDHERCRGCPPEPDGDAAAG